MNTQDIRWKQRFQNFEKAYTLLSGALEGKELSDFDDLQKEGLVQRFEYTYELLWKTLKDYLDSESIAIEVISPKGVIKAAAFSNILEIIGVEAECLLDMIDSRNLLSRTYSENRFQKVLSELKEHYLTEITKVYLFFKERINE